MSTNAELVTANVIQKQTASILLAPTPVSVSQVTKAADSRVNVSISKIAVKILV